MDDAFAVDVRESRSDAGADLRGVGVGEAAFGNALSWVYSVEWPVFSLLAIAGWWYLIHEDPEVYRARKQRPPAGTDEFVPDLSAARPANGGGGGGDGPPARPEDPYNPVVEGGTARLATMLALLTGVELALGVAALVLLPVGRPSGWLPARWVAIYLAHAILGLPLGAGAVALLARVRRSTRSSRLTGWIGGGGVAVAGAGGLLTAGHSLRVAGMALMLVGTLVAGFGYLIPALERSS